MLSKKTRNLLLKTGVALSLTFLPAGLPVEIIDTYTVQAAVVDNVTGKLTVKASSVWAYSSASWIARSRTYSQGTVLNVTEKHIVDGRYMYKLDNGLFITANTSYVSFAPNTVQSTPAVSTPSTEDWRSTTVNLNMRSGAGTGYSILLTIPKGTSLKIESISGTWAKVSYSGRTGYVSTAYLVSSSAPAPAPAPVPEVPTAEDWRSTTANLNMRSGAGTGYSILTTIPKGTSLRIESLSGTWAKVSYSGRTGYVSTAYLVTVSAPAPAPTPEPAPAPAPAPAPVTEDWRSTTANLNMRAGAGTSYSILLTIPKSSVLKVEAVTGTWAKVSYGGKTGYVSTAYLMTAPAPVPEPAPAPEPTPEPAPVAEDWRATTANLNMRSGAGTSYAIIVTIPSGTKLKVEGISGTWAKVSYSGKTGYVSTAYLVQAAAPVPELLPSKIAVDTVFREVYSNEDIAIRGWALSDKGVTEVRVILDGIDIGAAVREARPDVLAAYPAYTANAEPGYTFTLGKDSISTGSHTISIKALSADGTSMEKSFQFTEVDAMPMAVIEKPTGTVAYGDVEVSGYVLNNAGVKSAEILVNGVSIGMASTGLERGDVAARYPFYSNALTSGYSLTLSKARFARGQNTVTVKTIGNDGTSAQASVSINFSKPFAEAVTALESPIASEMGNEDILVKGYALDDTGVKSVKVLLNGKATGTAAIGIARPEIETQYPGFYNSEKSGFEYTIRRNNLFPGVNTVTVNITFNDGRTKSLTHTVTVDKIPLIIIDAGHGGTDPGASGYLNGIRVSEKTYVLQFAKALDEEVRALGYRTLLTRTEDVFVDLSLRAKVANDADGDLFFSIHHDYSSTPTSSGAFLIYPSQKTVSISDSAIAESIDVSGYLKKTLIAAGFRDRRNGYDIDISGHTLAVLRQSEMRSVLAEIGYMSNAEDILKIADPVLQKAVAFGLAQQIKAYFERQ